MTKERLNRITVEEGKCGGRPCLRGQRIRVTDILELLAAGASHEEILTDYPTLEAEDIWPRLNTRRFRPTTRFCVPLNFLVDHQLPVALALFSLPVAPTAFIFWMSVCRRRPIGKFGGLRWTQDAS